ncbi:hypothetical protein PDQ31_26605 [Bacillus cereus]|uniref:hypothetical protein n=1 Tax=Bacillus cereus TaxID=1396 RepID=UPI000279AE80|nr:hypothetical protein [Bacillus cereus]EJR71376.1 hypothetical protein IK9_06027 [Bacillus cereus VD166]MDA2655866.1 hypothetical protein [Bacillus cereus]
MKTDLVEKKCLVVEAKKYLVGQPSPGEAVARWHNYMNAKRECNCGKCPKE